MEYYGTISKEWTHNVGSPNFWAWQKIQPVCGDDLGDGVWHVVHHISMDSNIDSNIVNQR